MNAYGQSGPAMTWAIFAINLMALSQETQNRSHFLHGEQEFAKSYQYLGGISGRQSVQSAALHAYVRVYLCDCAN